MGVLAPSVWRETASYQIAVGIKSHRDVEVSEVAGTLLSWTGFGLYSFDSLRSSFSLSLRLPPQFSRV